MSVDRRTCLVAASALAFGANLRPVVADLPVLTIMAAISLKAALDRIASLWKQHPGNASLRIAYGASNALARQIEQGAPGDCFLSADLEWMNYLALHGLLRADTQREIASNRLVIIRTAAPEFAGTGGQLDLSHPANLRTALGAERMAVARTDLVPAGRYAREALQALGIWEDIRASLVETEHPHAALQLVARGEARLGIVYRSDVLGDARVHVVAEVPEPSHKPIRYPAAVLQSSRHPQALKFLDWLSSDAARKALLAAGFGLPGGAR